MYDNIEIHTKFNSVNYRKFIVNSTFVPVNEHFSIL